MPITQHANSSLSIAAQSHALTLSADFFDKQSVVEINMAMNRGYSVSSAFAMVYLRFLPKLVDLFIAFGYLWLQYGQGMGLLVLLTMISYIYMTRKLYPRSNVLRRNWYKARSKSHRVGFDSLDNWNVASVSGIKIGLFENVINGNKDIQYVTV